MWGVRNRRDDDGDRRRRFPALIGRSFSILARHPIVFGFVPGLGPIAGVSIGAGLALCAIWLRSHDADVAPWLLVGVSAVAALVSIATGLGFANAVVAALIAGARATGRIRVASALGIAVRSLPRIIETQACKSLVIGLSVWISIVASRWLGGLWPALRPIAGPVVELVALASTSYFVTVSLLAVEAAVLERRRGIGAVWRSVRLVRGRAWRAFGILLVATLGFLVVAALVMRALPGNSVQVLGEALIRATNEITAGFAASYVLGAVVLGPLAWLAFLFTSIAAFELHQEAAPLAPTQAPVQAGGDVERRSHRARWMAAAAVGIALAIGISFWSRDPDGELPVRLARSTEAPPGRPVLDERALAAWQLQIADPDLSARRDASATATLFDQSEHAALPALLAAIGDADLVVRRNVIESIEDVIDPDDTSALEPLRNALDDPDPYVRQRAARALGVLGPNAAPARASLRRRIDDSNAPARDAAMGALVEIGGNTDEIVPLLVERLGASASGDRARTVAQLAEIGVAAIPLLEAALQDADATTAHGIVDALAQIGAPAAPALARALRVDSLDVHAAAFAALKKLGPAAAEAVPVLCEMLSDPESGAPTTPAPDSPARYRPSLPHDAALVLGSIGEPAVPALLATIRANEGRPMSFAFDALREMNPHPKSAFPDLIAMTRDADSERARLAFVATGWIEHQNPARIDAARELLVRGDDESKQQVLNATSSMGAGAAALAPEIELLLEGPLRTSALGTLARVAPDRPATLLALQRALRSDEPDRIGTAIYASEFLGPHAAPLVPDLAARAGAEEPERRIAATRTLAKLGRVADAAAPALVRNAKDPHLAVCLAAVDALGTVGAVDVALPALEASLADPRPEVARDAVLAIAARGDSAQPLIGAVARLIVPDGPLRIGAVHALVQIGPASIPTLERIDAGNDAALARKVREGLATLARAETARSRAEQAPAAPASGRAQ